MSVPYKYEIFLIKQRRSRYETINAPDTAVFPAIPSPPAQQFGIIATPATKARLRKTG
jgi:hypothetical protein